MDTITIIIGGALALLLSGFMLRLIFTIAFNLINGRKFHHSLEKQFSQLRLSKMLTALGINKTHYIHQTSVNDIHQQMNSCSACKNTGICDEKLAATDIDITGIEFCNNESDLKIIKQNQSAKVAPALHAPATLVHPCTSMQKTQINAKGHL